MKQVNIHEAKTHLSALIDRAVAGEPFVIAKAGTPLVTVSPISGKPKLNRIGFLKKSHKVPSDFDDMGKAEIIAMFESKA